MDIREVNLDYHFQSTWHALSGLVLSTTYSTYTFNNLPGQFTFQNISAGGPCSAGVYYFNLLFSNSSTSITALKKGDLSTLDNTIAVQSENGTSTFGITHDYTTGFGEIKDVPSVYTNSLDPNTFLFGYMQDQDDNLVFITPVVITPKLNYKGQSVNYQLMLPTRSAQPTNYYLTLDRKCKPSPSITYGDTGGGAGGGPRTRRPTSTTNDTEDKEDDDRGDDTLNLTDEDRDQSINDTSELVDEIDIEEPEPALSVGIYGVGRGEIIQLKVVGTRYPANIKMEVVSPDGSTRILKTSNDGRVTFTAPIAGDYTVNMIQEGLKRDNIQISRRRPLSFMSLTTSPFPKEDGLAIDAHTYLRLIALILLIANGRMLIFRYLHKKISEPKKG